MYVSKYYLTISPTKKAILVLEVPVTYVERNTAKKQLTLQG